MGTLTNVLRIADQFASFDEDGALFGALGKIGRDWTEIAKTLVDIQSVSDLLKQFAQDIENQRYDAIFQQFGLSDALATLRQGKARLGDLIANIPEPLANLMQPVGNFTETAIEGGDHWKFGSNAGLISLPLLNKEVGAGGEGARYSLNAGVGAVIECEAGALWPFDGDQINQPLFRIGAQGHARAGTSGQIPFRFGAIGGSADAGVAFTCQYFFHQEDAGRIFAAQLATALIALPNPFDYRDIRAACALSGLGGLIITFDGETDIGVEVSLAQDLQLARMIKAGVGISFGLSLRRAGNYVLSLISDRNFDADTSGIRATLSRTKEKSKKWSVGAGLDLDLSELAPKVHAVLAEALETWEGGLEAIKPYLTPGTLIETELAPQLKRAVGALVGGSGFKEALAADLTLALGIDSDDDSMIAGWLQGQITGALDRATGLLGDQKSKTLSVLDELIKAIPGFAREEVRALALGQIGDLEAEMQSKLAETVGKLDPAKLAGGLEKLGIDLPKVGDRADQALAGVRALIDRYDRLFHKVVDVAKAQAAEKIALRLTWEQEKVSEVQYEVTGTFRDGSADAARLYDAMVSGRLKELQQLFEAPTPAFVLDESKSSIRRFSRVSKSFGYELILFGFGVSGRTLIDGEAEVFESGEGVIRVDAKGTFEREVKGPNESRKLTFVNTHSVLMTRIESQRLPEARQSMAASFSMIHVDDKLRRFEVAGFFGQLVNARLIPATTRDAALAKFDEWNPTPGNKQRIRGDISLQLGLANGDAQRLMMLDVQPKDALSAEHRVALGGIAAAALHQAGAWARDLEFIRKANVEQLDSSLGDDALVDALIAIALTREEGNIKAKGSDNLDDAMKLTFKFVCIATLMRDIYLATPKLADHEEGWSEADYRNAEIKLAKACKSWIKTNETIFGWFKPENHPRTLALMIALLAAGTRRIGDGISWPADRLAITLRQRDQNGTLIDMAVL